MTDITCISPIDGAEVARRAIASAAEIAAALAAARAAQAEWRHVPLGPSAMPRVSSTVLPSAPGT